MGEYKTTYNNSRGYVVEYQEDGEELCSSWLLLPAENLWHEGVRGFLYIVAMIFIFMGIAIASDLFMSAIEVITSKKRMVVRWDEERQVRVEKEILVWNETVANLTLMALGSSAPEILLAVIETCQNLDKDVDADGLGTFTIIGSAAFNLLIITAICIFSVPTPEVKGIKELGVFALTSVWSIFAYFWMLVVLSFVSPGVIEPWEAWVTLAFFPAMVLTAYCQDCGWWIQKCCKKKKTQVDAVNSQHVRIVHTNHHGNLRHTGPSKELNVLEKEKSHIRESHTNLKAIDGSRSNLEESQNGDFLRLNGHASRPASAASILSNTGSVLGSDKQRFTRNSHSGLEKDGSQSQLIRIGPDNSANKTLARARFRHAAVRSMMGGKKKSQPVNVVHKPKFAEVVDAVTKSTMSPGYKSQPTAPKPEELVGKFTFAAPSYSVLESGGTLKVDILFHRKPPVTTPVHLSNGNANGSLKTKETAFNGNDTHTGVVAVEFETREGSGKFDHDFKFTQGSMVFKETEWKKTITVPIINDDQYEADKDFYIFLKNPSDNAGIGDPSVTRVTIIDDDEPGEFQFEQPHYYADLKAGMVTIKVVRQKGCDGTVSVEYSTIDGTAKGGEKLANDKEYKKAEGVLSFKHGETSKTLSFEVDPSAKGSKNFIITLRNPSLGAKIGEHSATVANITKDDIAERLAEVIADDEEEDVTWGGQFKSAMVLECETGDDGKDIPLKWYDYLLHFFCFFWKVVFACVPPTSYLGAYPTFLASLVGVGILTALVEQIGTLLGCVIGIKTAVSGITIIALGTSLPDTFASRTAALHDEYADAAIGNVTGSNSVNVFLGLGLPWVIKSLYLLNSNKTYKVETGNVVSSVVIFTICGTICIFILLIRRKMVGGELGGEKPIVKYGSALFLILLWVLYIVLSSVKAYHPDSLPW